ncbi:tetraspanin-3 [Bombina bombina]|uniref:tetraspanin-3 n=1 Tax=Bombina bombina TaxID=8345 RepID=UPI00235A7B29|nr:tetraspanin-3 [Bombina bombina]
MGRCADRTSRVCIGLLVLLFWGAAATVAYAAYVSVSTFRTYKPFFHHVDLLLPCCLALTGGVFLVINGLIGLCVSKNGSRCQQGTFMYIIVIVICLEASAAILTFLYIHKMDYELNPMVGEFTHYNGSYSDGAVDKVQKELKCCGLNNYTDWEITSWYEQNSSVPKTCCNTTFTWCTGDVSLPNQLYQEGCFVKLHHRISFHMTLLFWSCIGIICVKALAAINDGVLMTRNPFQDFRILDSGTFA